jgi:hypothetical protein
MIKFVNSSDKKSNDSKIEKDFPPPSPNPFHNKRVFAKQSPGDVLRVHWG